MQTKLYKFSKFGENRPKRYSHLKMSKFTKKCMAIYTLSDHGIRIRLNHSPPCWMKRHHFRMKVRPRVFKKNWPAESSSTSSISSEVWHRNQVDIPSFTNTFIEKMASENLTVKVTLTTGYNFFHESYIHFTMLKVSFQLYICIEHQYSMIINIRAF